MSGSLRAAIPKVCRAFVSRRPSHSTRHFHRHRLVPIRSVFDDFFNHGPRNWPFRMMEDHMRSMEKMVDAVRPWNGKSGRMCDPELYMNPRAARDIQVKHTAREFEVKLETEGYTPENLTVKVVGDELSISGKMKETDQYGTVSAEFSRCITIPENVELESLESMFTQEGHLVVKGKVTGSDGVPERTINITREAPSSGEGAKPSEATPSGEKKD